MSLTATNGPLVTGGLAFVLAASASGMEYQPVSMTYELGSYVTEEIITLTLRQCDADSAKRRAIAAASISDAQLALLETDDEPMN